MRPLINLTQLELKLFLRDPITLIFTFAFPFFVLFILAGVFGNEPESEEDLRVWRGVGPTDYYIPAYIGLVMASIGLLAMPLHLAAYRESGVLRRFRASAVDLTSLLGSQVAVAALMSVAGGASILIAGKLAFDTFWPRDVALVIAGAGLGFAAFAAIGMFLGAVLPTARAAQSVGLVLFFVMMFISGAGPPREVMDSAMQTFGEGLPLTHVILVLQDPWLGHGWSVTSSAVTAGFLVVGAGLTAALFRWD